MNGRTIYLLYSLAFGVCVFSPTNASGTAVVQGLVVVSQQEVPVSGVWVSIPELSQGTRTDRKGTFRLEKVPPGEYTLTAQREGFEASRQALTVEEGRTETEVRIELNRGIVEMDEVVVTGVLSPHKLKNTPVITEVIRQEEIRDIGAATLADVLSEQTGLEVKSGLGRTQSARVYGLKDNHVLILVDGQRISGEVNGALDLGQIPLDQVEKIETVKGPLSSMYGSDALGGVINIITRQPEDIPTLTLGATAGSFGRRDYTLSAGRRFKDVLGEGRNVSLSASGSWIAYDGIDYSEADNISEVPGYDRKNVSLSSSFDLDPKVGFNIKGSYYTDESSWLEGDDDNIIRNDATNDKLTIVGDGLWHVGTSDKLGFSASYSTNEHGLDVYFKRVLLDREFSKRPGGDLSTETLQDYHLHFTTLLFDSGLIQLGAQHNRETIESNRVTDGEASTFSNILYAESEWHRDEFTYVAGARLSHNSDYGTFLEPRLSLMYKPSEIVKVRLAYGRGYSEPTLKDLTIDYANTAVGYRVQGDPDLQPEKSHGFNAGIEYAPISKVWLRLNAYYNLVSELIEFYQKSAEGEALVFSYRNVEEAVTSGAELDITWSVSDNIDAKVGYVYTSAVDGDGNTLDFTIPHTVTYKISGQVPAWGLRANIFGRWMDEQPVTDIQSDADNVGDPVRSISPSHAIVNVNVQKTFLDGFEVSAGVSNIGNVTHYPFGQMKQREFYAGLRYTLQ